MDPSPPPVGPTKGEATPGGSSSPALQVWAWSEEEDAILLAHVRSHGTRKWKELVESGRLQHRSTKACCNRFRRLRELHMETGMMRSHGSWDFDHGGRQPMGALEPHDLEAMIQHISVSRSLGRNDMIAASHARAAAAVAFERERRLLLAEREASCFSAGSFSPVHMAGGAFSSLKRHALGRPPVYPPSPLQGCMGGLLQGRGAFSGEFLLERAGHELESPNHIPTTPLSSSSLASAFQALATEARAPAQRSLHCSSLVNSFNQLHGGMVGNLSACDTWQPGLDTLDASALTSRRSHGLDIAASAARLADAPGATQLPSLPDATLFSGSLERSLPQGAMQAEIVGALAEALLSGGRSGASFEKGLEEFCAANIWSTASRGSGTHVQVQGTRGTAHVQGQAEQGRENIFVRQGQAGQGIEDFSAGQGMSHPQLASSTASWDIEAQERGARNAGMDALAGVRAARLEGARNDALAQAKEGKEAGGGQGSSLQAVAEASWDVGTAAGAHAAGGGGAKSSVLSQAGMGKEECGQASAQLEAFSNFLQAFQGTSDVALGGGQGSSVFGGAKENSHFGARTEGGGAVHRRRSLDAVNLRPGNADVAGHGGSFPLAHHLSAPAASSSAASLDAVNTTLPGRIQEQQQQGLGCVSSSAMAVQQGGEQRVFGLREARSMGKGELAALPDSPGAYCVRRAKTVAGVRVVNGVPQLCTQDDDAFFCQGPAEYREGHAQFHEGHAEYREEYAEYCGGPGGALSHECANDPTMNDQEEGEGSFMLKRPSPDRKRKLASAAAAGGVAPSSTDWRSVEALQWSGRVMSEPIRDQDLSGGMGVGPGGSSAMSVSLASLQELLKSRSMRSEHGKSVRVSCESEVMATNGHGDVDDAGPSSKRASPTRSLVARALASDPELANNYSEVMRMQTLNTFP